MTVLPAGWEGADAVFFDCDSTLSTLEGIDELARRRGVDVAELTNRAMDGELPMDRVYAARLELILPDAEDFAWLARRYGATAVPGAAEVVASLQGLGVACHVVSGGLRPAILPFAAELGIPPERVHAVPYPLDAADPVAVAAAHPLARNGGKPAVVAEVCAGGPPRARRLLVGDGSSDLEAAAEVGLFVGFGGVVDRPRVAAAARVHLRAPGLWAVAALAAGPARAAALASAAPEVHDAAFRDLADPSSTAIRNP